MDAIEGTKNGIVENRECSCYNDYSKNKNIDKYKLNRLFLEVTRKCNFNCKHCMRGESQNVTITRKIIDRIFDEIEDVTEQILLTGGEPLLAIDEIEYFCNKLIESNWTAELQIVTNGNAPQEANERIIDILCKLAKKKKIHCRLYVSVDQYHSKLSNINCRDICNYFIEEIKKYGVLWDKNLDNINGFVDTGVFKDEINKKYLYFTGNARTYKEELDKDVVFFHTSDMKYPHRIRTTKNVINCCMSILANGNISLIQNYAYEYADKTAIGNIIDDDFKEVIDNYNQNIAMCDCWETFNYYDLLSHYDFHKGINDSMKSYLLINIYRYQRILEARKIAYNLYPDSKDKIIDLLYIPTENEWLNLLMNLYIITYPNDKTKYFNADDMKEKLLPKLLSMLDNGVDLGRYNFLNKDSQKVKKYFTKYGLKPIIL